MTIEQVARSYMAAFVGRDVDHIASHVSETFINEHTSALGSGCTGKQSYLDRLPGFLKDMIDLSYLVDDVVVQHSEQDQPDRGTVVVFYTMTSRWQGVADIAIRGVQRLEIDSGLITRRTDYWDSAAFLVQASAEARTALAPFGVTQPAQ